ncbi:MAG: COR domain-containing protein [Leptolyngbyaceae cyanobacterium MO_188.B28]|nr:COR domain-containing protein [Leptolyngbyaceae cyanobacterium MO_188.B28]
MTIVRAELQDLPASFGDLATLKELLLGADTRGNLIRRLPECLHRLKGLTRLWLTKCELDTVPPWLSDLTQLVELKLESNKIADLPASLGELQHLEKLDLEGNPLNPELAAAYGQGLDAVKAYLRAKAEDQIVLNEAKLILIGEGEVGKSCLLDALRGEPWQKHDSTHGIEIKPVPVTHRNNNGAETEITLNTWDFGGQKVYRPTHQFFFSAPAVYLVVWKPREGPQQGAVEYWINTIKHRAGPDAKVLIVGTHGGPQQRQPDIDLQDLRDKFGSDCVLGAFHIDSRPEHYDKENDTWFGERKGMAELREAIANVSAALPNVGREVATSWNNVLKSVKERSEKDPYISYEQFEELCQQQNVLKELAKTYAGMLTQLGYVIHYGSDDDLKEIMILKPDWLAKAISFVLDDQTTRERNGLVSHERLTQLWNDPPYDYEEGYPQELHPLFCRLMERFDISYQVILDPASNQPSTTSLIAQLVDDKSKPLPDWGEQPQSGDEEKRQICQIVERDKNQSANAEGLFYRLIARLHKYSLGREDYAKSVHWQRGLMLDDGYNGRALLKHIGNDVHITVRAAFPEHLLHELTKEVKWLVESPEEGWAGLRCEVMVPCIEPCGLKDPGRGMFEVGKLIESKRRGRPEYPCDAAGCDEWQNIECLLRNAPARRRPIQSNDATAEANKQQLDEIRDLVAVIVQKWESGVTGPRELWIEKLQFFQAQEAIASDAEEKFKLKKRIEEAKQKITELQSPDDLEGRVLRSLIDPSSILDNDQRRLMSQVDDQFATLMQISLDEARNGPRLFSLTPTDTGFLDNPAWVNQKFQLTLWCEHSRKPLPVLWEDESRGTYPIEWPRDWVVKHGYALRTLTKTLRAILPVVSAKTKITIPDDMYKEIEKGLDLSKALVGSALTGGGALADISGDDIISDAEHGVARQAQNAMLRELHAFLKKRDPGFGGLQRVQNKRREFLWVHPRFKDEY